jgi:hypothetical protein
MVWLAPYGDRMRHKTRAMTRAKQIVAIEPGNPAASMKPGRYQGLAALDQTPTMTGARRNLTLWR